MKNYQIWDEYFNVTKCISTGKQGFSEMDQTINNNQLEKNAAAKLYNRSEFKILNIKTMGK